MACAGLNAPIRCLRRLIQLRLEMWGDRDIGRKIAGNEELKAVFAVARERVAIRPNQHKETVLTTLPVACPRRVVSAPAQ